MTYIAKLKKKKIIFQNTLYNDRLSLLRNVFGVQWYNGILSNSNLTHPLDT